jgi:hypothetical protein
VHLDGAIQCNGLKRRLEGFLLKNKYVVWLLTLIQVIWFKGSQGTYIKKKFMFLVALVELGHQWIRLKFISIIYTLGCKTCLQQPNQNKRHWGGHKILSNLGHWYHPL